MIRWWERLEKLGSNYTIDTDLSGYWQQVSSINDLGKPLCEVSDEKLAENVKTFRARADTGVAKDTLTIEGFALIREISSRILGMRHFDVQLIAGLGLLQGKLVEMQTGEGKTLAAVLPACLMALSGKGVHILTFNDYLARRDAAWMKPLFAFMGLSVGCIQEGMLAADRRAAYAADVTYATAKEAGFDYLRMHLARNEVDLVQRPFHFAIVDEADSILIDEARVPLVIAGERARSETDPYKIAALIHTFIEGEDWETDENRRNVLLTEKGIDKVEAALDCGDLHAEKNFLLLTEVNQALHAKVLLHNGIDYIVREERIEIIDEFTGRVVDDRRWPDGLQEALEAKEGLPIQPGGQILGAIALQNFLRHYPILAGMTATASTSSEELYKFYNLRVLPVPRHKTSCREDLPSLIFTHTDAKNLALVDAIKKYHTEKRPVLVGTSSVNESEQLATLLRNAGIPCTVLNAKNDEAEAAIISGAGMPAAVTISTNMAGRGTDIKLGGADEKYRNEVVATGGLMVIGTNMHESQRIDDQLRGRAGRQGDPGSSQFFVSLEDKLMTTFGIQELIPERFMPDPQDEPLDHPVITREVARIQRIVQGQNYEIRKTMWRYSQMVEKQRIKLMMWRQEVFNREAELHVFEDKAPARYAAICARYGKQVAYEAERQVALHFIDVCWSDHLSVIAQIREGIHLVGIGGLEPLNEFHKQIADAFWELLANIEERTAQMLAIVPIGGAGINEEEAGIQGPSSTWTYLINDRVTSDLMQMLFGNGSAAFVGLGVLMTWPLLLAWGIWKRIKMRS